MSSNRAKALTELLRDIDVANPDKYTKTIRLILARLWGEIDASKLYNIDDLHYYLDCYFHIISKYAAQLGMDSSAVTRRKINIYAKQGGFFAAINDYENAIPFYTNALLLLEVDKESDYSVDRLNITLLRLYAYVKLKNLSGALKDIAFIDDALIKLGVITDTTAQLYGKADSISMKFSNKKYGRISFDFNKSLSVLFEENIKGDIGEIIPTLDAEHSIPEGGLFYLHYNKTGLLEDAVFFITKSVQAALVEPEPNHGRKKIVLAASETNVYFDKMMAEIKAKRTDQQKVFEIKALLTYLLACIAQSAPNNDQYTMLVAEKLIYLAERHSRLIEQYHLLPPLDLIKVQYNLARLYCLDARHGEALPLYEKMEKILLKHQELLGGVYLLRLLTSKLTVLFEMREIMQVIHLSTAIQSLIHKLGLSDQWEEVVAAGVSDEAIDTTNLFDMSDNHTHSKLTLETVYSNILVFFRKTPKEDIFNMIHELDIPAQKKILNDILLHEGLLAVGFWQKRGAADCSIDSGMLKKIVAYLAKLDGKSDAIYDNISQLVGVFSSIFTRKPVSVTAKPEQGNALYV